MARKSYFTIILFSIFMTFLLSSLFFATQVAAYDAEHPLLSPTPQCADIRNKTNRTVYVGVRTNYFMGKDKSKERHEASLRLDPNEHQQVCATGPFYDDYRVEIILRTIMPLFDCKTKLEGSLTITATDAKTDDGDTYTKLSLDCR